MEGVDASALSKVDEKGFVPDEVRNAFFRKLRMKHDNRTCFECPNRNPTWISLTYGVYLCLECSGEHRRKGVHISFVRSVELDRFSPDQMVQMSLGGNARALTHFKAHAMGKTSEGGRPVDYNSKVAERYKQQLEKETKDACAKLSVACKSATQAPLVSTDPIDEATEFAGPPSPSAVKTAASAPTLGALATSAASATQPKSGAKSAAPTSVVIRKSTSDMTPSAAPPSPAVSSTSAPAVGRPSGFAGSKQMAKQIEFDFDFDELENEASKPAPVVPPPKAAAPAAVPVPAPSTTMPASAPVTAPAWAHPASETEQTGKFSKAKAISSDDFFFDVEQESATQKLEREQRYNKFSSSAAISSSSFFNNGEDDSPGAGSGDDWKVAAKAGLSKGAELLTTYLNKVRD
mmetsp:Transcript_23727/g.74682  ORF Transcript_23727/g.74682 Transcript_23727/m.74682 type:complete len:405 (+) Transcript_23727:75-1289(+)